MKKVIKIVCVVAVLLSSSTVLIAGEIPSFMGLGDLPTGGFQSVAQDVSADGSVVVGMSLVDGNMHDAFRWTEATDMVGLSGGTIYCRGTGASFDGSVVVGANYSVNPVEAFRWTQGTGIVNLGSLGRSSHAEGVSADGSVVVGRSGTLEAFRWTQAAGMVGLGGLDTLGGIDSTAFGVSADGSVIVGGSESASGHEAFRWTEQTGMVGLGDLPGGDYHSYFRAVSPDGSVAVGFRWATW